MSNRGHGRVDRESLAAEARLRARLERRQAAAQGDARTWQPHRGDEDSPNPLLGVLEDVESAVTRFGDARVATVIDADGATWKVWLTPAVLLSEWEAAAPAPGETVGVAYQGKRASADGERAYHVFRVELDRAETETTPAVAGAADGHDEPPF